MSFLGVCEPRNNITVEEVNTSSLEFFATTRQFGQDVRPDKSGISVTFFVLSLDPDKRFQYYRDTHLKHVMALRPVQVSCNSVEGISR